MISDGEWGKTHFTIAISLNTPAIITKFNMVVALIGLFILLWVLSLTLAIFKRGNIWCIFFVSTETLH